MRWLHWLLTALYKRTSCRSDEKRLVTKILWNKPDNFLIEIKGGLQAVLSRRYLANARKLVGVGTWRMAIEQRVVGSARGEVCGCVCLCCAVLVEAGMGETIWGVDTVLWPDLRGAYMLWCGAVRCWVVSCREYKWDVLMYRAAPLSPASRSYGSGAGRRMLPWNVLELRRSDAELMPASLWEGGDFDASRTTRFLGGRNWNSS